jgi:hypothetical protein
MIKSYFLLPMPLFTLGVPTLGVAQSSAESMSAAEKDTHSLLSAFMSYTDLRIRSLQRSLEILASTNEAKSGNWSDMKDLLSRFQKSDDGLIVWYLRPDDTYYTGDKGLRENKLSDRSYLPDLMAGKKITGALVISKATGERSAIIAVPIEMDGKVVGAIGSSLFLDKLSARIDAALDLRPDATFFALAPDGLTTLNRKTDRDFLDPREMGSETLKDAANEILSNTSGKTTYDFDNVTKHAIYATSSLTGWKFAIAYRAIP